jgi:hypothetical protein
MRRNAIQTSVMLVVLLLPLLVLIAQETSSLLIEEAAGTDKSDSGAREKLCRSGRISPDHGRIAALRGESDHSDIARERRCVNAAGQSAASPPVGLSGPEACRSGGEHGH